MNIAKRVMLLHRVKSLIPKYARLPILIALIFNCAVFWLTRPITAGLRHYDLSLPIDSALPLIPAFVVIYVLAFFQWLVGYVLICRDSRERCYRVMSGEIVSKTVCLVFFLVLPTSMTRPEITGSDIFSRMLSIVYALDTPDNLFPSIHIIESWLCFRGSIGAKSLSRGYKASMLLFTLLVTASVVLVKQHLVVDIISGVAVAELGQLIAARAGTGRLLERLNSRVYGEAL